MPDRTPAPVPPSAEFAKFAAYLDERARASMEAGTVGYPSPSAAPPEQTSELTDAGRIAKRHAEELERVKKYAFADGVAAGRTAAAADIRAAPYPDPSPCIPAWHAGYVEAWFRAARIAEGTDHAND